MTSVPSSGRYWWANPILLNLLLRRADALRCAGDFAAARVDYRNA